MKNVVGIYPAILCCSKSQLAKNNTVIYYVVGGLVVFDFFCFVVVFNRLQYCSLGDFFAVDIFGLGGIFFFWTTNIGFQIAETAK